MSLPEPGAENIFLHARAADLLERFRAVLFRCLLDDPPDVGLPTNSTQYSYNIDRQLTQILRPDGQATILSYDTGGRLSSITSPDGR
jgi:YD repeat-containing protein